MNIVRRFVNNPVAANMIMILILGGGFIASLLIPREIFPEFSLDMITITVPYPGAPPVDIEKGICLKVEDYLKNVEGIKEVSSASREGTGTVTLELETTADVRKVLDDVKSEVDKITFPENAEDPVVKEVTMKRHVILVAISGNAPERTLKEIAEDIRDDLTSMDDISQVAVSGTRKYEISVEINEQSRRRYKLTLEQVAKAIRESSFDLPAGKIRTSGGELSLRIVGQRYTAEEFKSIPVLYMDDGTVIYLRDIASVRESFEDEDVGGLFNGKPSVMVTVSKTSEEDTIKIANAVKQYISEKQAHFPEGIIVETWSDLSVPVRDRLDMLVRNGMQGLVLVFLVLWLFLGMRLSIWVALGIPISLLGTLLVMYLTGHTLNMLSMFAMIIALGLIVDDAIVIGENVYTYTERGELPRLAAARGTTEMLLPVIAAVVTTWLAFIPLMFMPGMMGKFIFRLPVVVIIALGFSLLECIIILPAHLAHSLEYKKEHKKDPSRLGKWFAAVRKKIDAGIHRFVNGPFMKLFALATKYRYVTVTIVIAVLVLTGGLYKAGRLPFAVFPKGESDTLKASVILPTGTSIERTKEVTRRMTRAAEKLNKQVQTDSGEKLVKRVYVLLGRQSNGQLGGHVAEVTVELLSSTERGNRVNTRKLIAMWRKNTGNIPDALSMSFGGFRAGPGAKSLEIRMMANTTQQAKILAERLQVEMLKYNGVSDVSHDALPGKMEIQITPKRRAYASRINAKILASQLRSAFYGNESIEIQRGRDEIKVMVRYPQNLRQSMGHIEAMRIKTPDGEEVPFTEVANVEMERGYTTLRRVGGKSVVTVTADIDEDIANAEQILEDMENRGYFDKLTANITGAKVDLRGQRQQRKESFESLKTLFPLALLGIYTILAAIFKSYIQPVIIMVAIPFGLVGAILGHWMTGTTLTILSMFGMVALAGIVVNDSLVLLDMVNRKVREGNKIFDSIRDSARERFRPIILTTLTTVIGMGPLLLERSFQAQFLKPMVISITFGLSFATMLTLLVVPCMYLIGNDIMRVWKWSWTGTWPSREDVIKKHHDPI